MYYVLRAPHEPTTRNDYAHAQTYRAFPIKISPTPHVHIAKGESEAQVMNMLGSVRISTLIHAGAVETLATILCCYVVAVTQGHVQPWLPMISDCAVYPPEKYPFRFGLGLSSFCIGVQTVAVNVVKGYSKVSLVLGLLASISLGIVSVVNEEENDSVHSGELSKQS